MEEILVTGAGGYLGKTVFHILQEEGLRVHALQERLENIPKNSLDYSCVVHCAGALRHRKKDLYSSNVLGTVRLLEGIRRTDCRIINISSKAVYAPGRLVLTEESSLITRGEDEYGRSKLDSENLIRESGYPFVSLRPTNIFGLGIGSLGPGFVANAVQKFMNNDKVTLYSPDRQQDFLYVKDLARIVLLALKRKDLEQLVLNCAGDSSSLHEFIQELAAVYKEKTSFEPYIQVKAGSPPRNAVMDNYLLKKTFPGYQFTKANSVFSEMINFALSEK